MELGAVRGLAEDPSRKGQVLGALAPPFPGRSHGFGLALTLANTDADSREGRQPRVPGFPRPGGPARAQSLPLGLPRHQVSCCRLAVGCSLPFISQNVGIRKSGFAGVHLGLTAFGSAAVCFLCFERQDAALFREDVASQRWIMTVIIPSCFCLFFLSSSSVK